MDASRYAATRFGRAKRTLGPHGYVAYFPENLPRSLELSAESIMLTAEAALGRLAGVGRLLANPQLLIYPYLRREAVASTRIEGTQASLSDVFDAEASERPLTPDVEEVVNYVRALLLGRPPTRSTARRVSWTCANSTGPGCRPRPVERPTR